MAAGAAELLFQCVFDGSLSIKDANKERRPYHKNCSCALHKRQSSVCSTHKMLSLPTKKPCHGLTLSVSASRLLSSSSCLCRPIQKCVNNKFAALPDDQQ
ncbi:hypothetical protein Leryth_011023 [Lithospermum erythrorhizon]|uniref:Uncharacterized protein n=1 Tax=Lithospermum erythrorhizon TaxID=34254 RepID=A0AAV3QGI0_LITER|nr:hypothetical protein Leryth_011023 [Lithospermum erythrorhizon]